MATDHIADSDAEARRLDVALQHLIESERVTRAQADAVRAEFAGTTIQPVRPPWTAVLPEVGGYVGGAFVLAAVVVLAAPRWDEWGRTGQIMLLVGSAVLALGAALAVALSNPGGWTPHRRPGLGARRRLVSVLFVLGSAAAIEAAAIIGGPGSGYGYGPAPGERTAATTAVVLGLAGYGLCRIALLHLGAVVSLAVFGQVWLNWAVLELSGPGEFHQVEAVTVVAQSAFIAMVALGWAVAAARGLLDERQLGLVSAGVLFFNSAENLAGYYDRPAMNAIGFLMLALLAAAGLVGYLRTRYVGILAVGVVALATVVPQAIIHYTDGALGAAGGLLVVGLSIIGASVLGLRLHRSTDSPERSTGTPGAGVRDPTGPATGQDLPDPDPRR